MEKDVTTLLLEWRGGNRAALDELMPLIYAEFRQLASRALSRERPNHTLQSTALAHELYLKLIDQKRAQWRDREHFFAMASQIIRRILLPEEWQGYPLRKEYGILQQDDGWVRENLGIESGQ